MEAITLVPPGVGCSRPTVARLPRAAAISRMASTVAAAASIGSRRSSIAVVPAWLPCPVNRNRHRPCATMPVATPIAAPVGASSVPCSTCSSTNAPIPAIRSGSGPTRSGSNPAERMASASGIPSRSVRRSASAAGSAPVSSREPRQGTPNRPPSSSTNTATASGRAGVKPSARSAATAASALVTPSGPSNAPPPGTESRCEPVTTANGPRWPSHQAQMLPLPSVSGSSPSRAGGFGEPLPQGQLRVGVAVPGVAATHRVPPDVGQLVEPHQVPTPGRPSCWSISVVSRLTICC